MRQTLLEEREEVELELEVELQFEVELQLDLAQYSLPLSEDDLFTYMHVQHNSLLI